ncbi:hypothetical protein ACNKHW_27215 [Shigella flexneri]
MPKKQRLVLLFKKLKMQPGCHHHQLAKNKTIAIQDQTEGGFTWILILVLVISFKNRLKKYYSPCEVSLKLRLQPEAVDNSVYKSLSETTKTSNNASHRCGYFIERSIGAG